MKEFDHSSVTSMNIVALTGMREWMTRTFGRCGIKWDTEVTREYPQLIIVLFESDKYKMLFDMKWESEYLIHASSEAAIQYWIDSYHKITLDSANTVIGIARDTSGRTQMKIEKGRYVASEQSYSE